MILCENYDSRIFFEIAITFDAYNEFWWFLYRLKALNLSFPSVQTSSKLDLYIKSYGGLFQKSRPLDSGIFLENAIPFDAYIEFWWFLHRLKALTLSFHLAQKSSKLDICVKSYKFMILWENYDSSIVFEIAITFDAYNEFWWFLYQMKALTLSFQSVQKSSKLNPCIKSYGDFEM